MINIIFNDLYCEDIIDDFEEFGRDERNFTLSEFIQNDFSRAFCVGYCYDEIIKQGLWIPTSIRKEIRHLADDLKDFNPQLIWLNGKYGICNKIIVKDYIEFILNNIFCDEKETLLRLAIMLGIKIKETSLLKDYDKT